LSGNAEDTEPPAFKLDTFDFGIAAEGSSMKLANDIFSLEIVGQQDVVERLWEDDDHPWHWVVYAPKFYVRDVPVELRASQSFARSLSEKDYETSEIGLYVGEHFQVLPCTISLNGGVIRVEGVVEHGLLDREVTLRIEWDMARPTDERPTGSSR
jgi:hypothetical protein